MKNLLIIPCLLLFITAFGQKSEVMARLEEYGIAHDFLDASLRDQDATHSFDITTTTNDGTKNIVNKGHFNPELPVGKRWTLQTTNGQPPSKKEIKKFDKAHNTKQPNINGKVDDASWKIAIDNDNFLGISFKYDRESLPHKYQFLADCTGTAYINKKTGRLESAEFVNDGPLKVKIFNVTELDMNVDYLYLEEEDAYFMEKEYLDMKVKLLGQIVEVEEINEYTNYKKVK